MNPSPEILAAGAVIILIAYFIRGVSGFGSGLIAVPLLAHLLPLKFVVPFVLILDFSASLVMSGKTRKHARWDEIRPVLPYSLVGVVMGALLLVNLPKEPLLTGLGAFVVFFGIRYVLNVHGDQPISRWWAAPAGLTGGTVSALFGTGGPPYVIYFSHRIRDKAESRATFSALFLLEGGMRIITFLLAGLLLQPDLILSLTGALPLMVLGLYLGNKAHVGITNQQMIRLIGVLLVCSGISLTWKAWS